MNKLCYLLAVVPVLCGLLPVFAGTAGAFSSKEKAAILSLGPWPPRTRPDPGNKYSGNRLAISFGRKLFFDRRLSRDSIASCADCHKPDMAFTDGVALNQGYGRITRHTPTVANLANRAWYGWGGEVDSLWGQSIRPLLSRNEMAMTPTGIRRIITTSKDLSCGFKVTFGVAPETLDKHQILVRIAKALAAWQETLVTGETAFDRFRTALETGNKTVLGGYPPAARRGLKLFVGKGRCNVCHFGPHFTNGEFSNIGVPFFVGKGKVDQGRYGGIRKLGKSQWNLLGRFNDDATGENSTRTRHVVQRHRNWGEFKVPSLRNVARTAPYMHNGSLAKLEDVIDFYSSLNEERLHTDGEKILRPLNLSSPEKNDLLAFLGSLTAPVSENSETLITPKICK
jgi:cytochrome c peroxidase